MKPAQKKEALRLLKRYMNDTHAEFKCVEQRTTVELTLYGEANLLVVLPTGGGKSLLFLLYAMHILYEGKSECVLLVVPYISLKQQFVSICRGRGLNVCVDCERYDGEEIIIVIVDAISNDDCLYMLSKLAREGKLVKIFVDEIHTYIVEGKFRPKMGNLVKIRRLQLPTILLTATLPTYMEYDIQNDFFPIGVSKIIHAPSNGPNLRYFVYTYSSLSMCEKFINLFHNKLRDDVAGKIIVYFSNISHLQHLNHKIHVQHAHYFSEMSESDKSVNALKWRGEVKVMLATIFSNHWIWAFSDASSMLFSTA